jgi:hypothetical protein
MIFLIGIGLFVCTLFAIVTWWIEDDKDKVEDDIVKFLSLPYRIWKKVRGKG